MSRAGRPHPVAHRRRVDLIITWMIIAVSVVTLVVTTWIAFRSWDAWWRFLTHPLRLQQVHAIWTGLLSSNLLVLQVVFMARLPWLERTWGRPAIMRLHRRLGYWSFWLMVAHVLLFVTQRVLRDPDQVPGALWGLFVGEPWMLPATLGTIMVVAVVATSIATARRRLRYEHWHLIHLWAYVGMGLALPHQLVSRDFMVGWTPVFWWALYLVALAVVVVFRVVVPLRRTAYHRLRIAEVRPEGPAAVSLIMTGHRLDRLGARAGQFFGWRFGGPGGWSHAHPYSLSQAPRPIGCGSPSPPPATADTGSPGCRSEHG